MSQHRDEFRSNGFAIVSGLLGTEQLKELRGAMEETILRVRADPQGFVPRYTANTAELVDVWGVNDILSPALYDPAYGEIFENPDLMAVVTELAEGSKLRFLGAHALFNPLVVDYDLNWHRDFGDDDKFDPEGGSAHVYVNICLLEDSSLRVVPGSNRRPLTEAEQAEQLSHGSGPLPGEHVVIAQPGDVVFTNNHTLHRGACSASTPRRMLHIGLQPAHEPTGGHSSWKFIRDEGYLDGMKPVVKELMRNLIEWEDANPLSLKEKMRRMRESRERRAHEARI